MEFASYWALFFFLHHFSFVCAASQKNNSKRIDISDLCNCPHSKIQSNLDHINRASLPLCLCLFDEIFQFSIISIGTLISYYRIVSLCCIFSKRSHTHTRTRTDHRAICRYRSKFYLNPAQLLTIIGLHFNTNTRKFTLHQLIHPFVWGNLLNIAFLSGLFFFFVFVLLKRKNRRCMWWRSRISLIITLPSKSHCVIAPNGFLDWSDERATGWNHWRKRKRQRQCGKPISSTFRFYCLSNFFPVASIWAGLFFRKRENSICLCHFVTRTLIKQEKGQKQQTKKSFRFI